MSTKEQKPEATYVLPRNELELKRLQTQHDWLRRTVYSDRLVYDETVQLSDSSRVLDSGTGTGAWILDLAKENPSSIRLDGVDISPNLFPKDHPANVHFTVASITDLPQDWTSQFDVVHQRLLIAALDLQEWPKAFSEIYRVCRPGASVHFAEIKPTFSIGDKDVGFEANKKVRDAADALYKTRGIQRDCALYIPQWLKDAGFVEIRADVVYAPTGKKWGKIGLMGCESNGGALRNMGPAIMKAGGLGHVGSLAEFDELIDRMIEEWNEADGMYHVYHMICARKPL